MKAQNVWQQAFDKNNDEIDEIREAFVEINRLTEGENNEAVEYYALLEELYNYGYCMSDNFRLAFEEEVTNSLNFERSIEGEFEDTSE